MSGPDLETERENAVTLLTGAYVRDLITMDQLEARLASVASAAGRSELAELIADLGGAEALRAPAVDPDFPEPLQKVRGTVRREGSWLRSRRLIVECIGSRANLDMTQICGHGGDPFVVDLSVKGSGVRIRVPLGTRVEEEIENTGGTVRIRRRVLRAQAADGPRLILRGESWGSSIVISPSDRRQRRT
jgi:hypothetical protein